MARIWIRPTEEQDREQIRKLMISYILIFINIRNLRKPSWMH
ncbi:hypothetical protein ACM6L3_05635 [Paenibacillus larvae]|nr:hypothetical protein ERICII_03898 [Paenibacillus larvae subsp. larvae DSM 25430]